MAELKNEIGMPKSDELKQLIRINEKLGKLIELNVDKRDLAEGSDLKLSTICQQKTNQANGDKVSRWLTLFGLSIAALTLYYNDSAFAQAVRLWINQWGAS
tara:strand:- start:308 stop:610 length:303 start_codon:yes stop_codon:yes gene_type:complete